MCYLLIREQRSGKVANMFSTLKTLINGANASAEEKVRDIYSIEIIDQKIREAQGSLNAAKMTLASLIQRQRSETRLAQGLQSRIDDMLIKAQAALDDGNETMATEAANAVAQMENELAVRSDTGARLDQKITRLRQSIETGNRRIIDLKQGAITAKAVKSEQAMQKRMTSTLSGQSSVREAEDMIANILGGDDPFEQAEIMSEIDNSLDHTTLGERMAQAGYGTSNKVSGTDVLSRLKSKS